MLVVISREGDMILLFYYVVLKYPNLVPVKKKCGKPAISFTEPYNNNARVISPTEPTKSTIKGPFDSSIENKNSSS